MKGSVTVNCEVHHHSGDTASILVELSHLPKPTTALIGRELELKQLTDSLLDDDKYLAIVVAAGGIGKSALVDEWLIRVGKAKYYGKTHIFGWSFYSQGTHESFTNSQPFFNDALAFFDVKDIPNQEIEKARLLAQLLSKHPTLLVLDGLEPLQYDLGLTTVNGELKDLALKEFIACFRRSHVNSFLLITSRQPLVELRGWGPRNYFNLKLDTLVEDDGVDLLRALGVKGTRLALKKISYSLSGHALSLVLMGHLLTIYHKGDCRYFKELPPLSSAYGSSDAEKDSRHALRVLNYYNSLLDDNSRHFLYLLGLFDRPMTFKEKEILFKNANIANKLSYLSAVELKNLEDTLENKGLLLVGKNKFSRVEWDIHPIIRVYFGDEFKKNKEAYRQANKVLFDFYCSAPAEKYPNIASEMSHLYRAVFHGCLAGDFKKVINEIYFDRIRRGYSDKSKSYHLHQLGAYSEDITMLSCFFDHSWVLKAEIKRVIEESLQFWLIRCASFCLMSIGRLQESLLLRSKDVERLEKDINARSKEPFLYVNICQNRADCEIPLGYLSDAKITVKKMINYSQMMDVISLRSNDIIAFNVDNQLMISYSYLGLISHFCGELSVARRYFNKAIKFGPFKDRESLYSLFGFYYLTFLLECAKDKSDILKIKEKALFNDEVTSNYYTDPSLLTIALDKLLLAQVYERLGDFNVSLEFYKDAFCSISKANKIEKEPWFYLKKIKLLLLMKNFSEAKSDLDYVCEIIESSNMKLYLVDYLIVYMWYLLGVEEYNEVADIYSQAINIVNEIGYHIHDAELDIIAARICVFSIVINDKDKAYYVAKATKRIEDIGQWGLLPLLEKVRLSG